MGVLVFVLGVLPLGPLGSWKAHFVRGDLGENLFRVYFAAPFRSSRPNLGPNNPLHKCACAPNPKRVKRGGKMNTAERFMQALMVELSREMWFTLPMATKQESGLCREGR